MKILVTTATPHIESEIDPRFGRAAYYLLIDMDTYDWQAVENPALNAYGGAGVQAAQFVVNHQISAVISSDFGPNAYEALRAAGIPMYLYGSCRTVHEAIERFKAGQLESVGAPHQVGPKGQGRRR
jgi:predicted Fe-Mo cluster-binding NifX family protein